NGTGNPTSTDWGALCADVKKFYTGTFGAGDHTYAYLGKQVFTAGNVHEVALYELDVSDPAHYFGSPVNVLPFNIATTGATNPLPNEVAAVVSLRAAYGTDPEHNGTLRPRADDRGRFYFGPLDGTALDSVAQANGTHVAYLGFACITTLKEAIQQLKTDS